MHRMSWNVGMSGVFVIFLQDAGVKLKEMIGEESVTFYVSPFVRSRQTYSCIRKCFTDDQVFCSVHSFFTVLELL